MEALLLRLNDAMNVNPNEAPRVYYEMSNSKYRQALMEVFVERKEFIRAQLDPTFYEIQPPSDQINQMLKKRKLQKVLDNPILPICQEDEIDEETEKLEEVYLNKMGELKNLLHSNLQELQQGCERIKADFCRVLRSQQMLRPIDHQDLSRALESIRRKHEITEIETKQTIANSVMLVQTRIAEATKRRRNFSKEAIAILQQYYDNHLAHPYPNQATLYHQSNNRITKNDAKFTPNNEV
ncbi:hypothetical protein DICVIV_13317 [Dictyocaulus viviparus]|uniref:PBC domain-containing protein n=1 Tax=Dictyocaulus viviparus TaxID=29172 RepID=A0A0D8X840_DICVI|nr:hypothetical protein DICVIV_13317 [Dictyocaulus viviparus]